MANETEIREIRYQVGEAWKGEYNPSVSYSNAAVVQDPTGLSVYRSRKSGNIGHPLTDAEWWFRIIDMSSIKQEGDALETLDEQVTENEAARAAAENERSSAEQERQSAESARATAESNRASAESGRVNAENARVTAENARAAAETSRVNAEAGRVSAEEARVLSENLRDSAESARAIAENNRAAAETERHTQYTADHSAAVSDHNTAQLDHTTAVADHEQATEDHTASVEATGEASNVNAEIEGMTVTITDRNGQSHSVNIGFDIAGTYGSVAAMNADAANVQEGAFVMIATLDPTSQENARLYVRNSTAPTSSEPFTFLSDLDQAATSAWADWMENYKPTIIADHQRAETDHTTAAADHTAAVSDHNTATTDHTQAASDHTTATSDHTAAASDHTRAESDHTTAAADHTQAEFDHSRAETDHNTMEPRIANLEENKANKDGYYSQMTVGAAETLVGETIDSADYLIRPTGGADNEVANGAASVIGMEGNSCVWNQLIQNGDFSNGITGWGTSMNYSIVNNVLIASSVAGSGNSVTKSVRTLPTGHKIYYSFRYKSNKAVSVQRHQSVLPTSLPTVDILTKVTGISTVNGSINNFYFYNYNTLEAGEWEFQLTDFYEIDLTLLGIDNLTTVAEVDGWLAEHVGLKPYYGYNAGSLLSAQTLGVKTYGQNLLNPITRQARLIPYEWEENSNVYTIKNVPSGATATFTPDATGVAETVDISGGSLDITSYGRGILELSAATSETYVCMKWDEGKDDDVVPFEEHTQNFDVRKVYGKVNGAGEYVQCFPGGLKSVGSVKDTMTAAGATKVIGDVDLGVGNYEYKESYNCFYSGYVLPSGKEAVNNNICVKYTKSEKGSTWQLDNLCVRTGARAIGIRDDSFNNDAAAFKTAMQGVPLYYELATPITYTDLIYRDGGIDTPITDVLFNIDVDNWSIEEQLLTPYDENGNPTAVPAKISTNYGMDAVEEIDTIKHTYVSAYNEQEFSDAQKAQARRNIGAVEADGSYPNMSVGIAKNLAGENAVEAEYTYRQSNGTIGTATGIANVTDVKGETLVWNQMLQQGKLVDLGLPSGLLWATSNIDITQEDGFAASPFQYGCTMFSWGNIEGHNTPASGTTFDYNWGSVNAQEPWYDGQVYGETTGAALITNIVAGDTQDAARFNLGSLFKMPTSTQFKELVDNCDFVQADGTTVIDDSVTDKRVTVNSVVGIYLKSKINGNLIFFSASGYGSGSSWYNRGANGYYWSASFFSSRNARNLSFSSGGFNPQNSDNRCSGFAVRAVVNPNTVDTGHNNHKYLVTKDINVDLTQMFGEGKEPSTVAEFEALYPLDYYDYNAGTLVNNNASAIETTGFNQWDEEWELGDIAGGAPLPSTTHYRSVNFTKVEGGVWYYFKIPNRIFVFWYDAQKNYLGSYIELAASRLIQVPANAAYFKINDRTRATYNHDICINISDPAKNGTYEPYEKHTFYFDKVLQGEGSLATIKGKLNGEGESVVVFPDGLKRAGNAYDEIKGNVAIKRIGSVDLGTLGYTKFEATGSYQTFFYTQSGSIIPNCAANGSVGTPPTNVICSNYLPLSRNAVYYTSGAIGIDVEDSGSVYLADPSKNSLTAAEFKAAMSGVILYYELATPETYILDQTVTGGYQVNANGTERRLPEDTASSVNAPVNYSVIYPINAVGTLIKLPVNYISEKSLTNFTTELASKLGTFLNATIGISATYNQTNQEYDYTITITANQ